MIIRIVALHQRVLCVLVQDENIPDGYPPYVRAYCAPVPGANHTAEAPLVRSLGAKLKEEEARGIFAGYFDSNKEAEYQR